MNLAVCPEQVVQGDDFGCGIGVEDSTPACFQHYEVAVSVNCGKQACSPLYLNSSRDSTLEEQARAHSGWH
eukprot:585473-Rhodomonas_salina.1